MIFTHRLYGRDIRNGRARLCLPGKGQRGYPDGTGSRRDLAVGIGWDIFRRRGFGVGWEMTWGTTFSETTPDFFLSLGWLGSVWVQFEGLIPYRWLDRHAADGRVDYDTRVFGFRVDMRHIEWDFWSRKDSWRRADPWWMHTYYTYPWKRGKRL